MSNVTYEVIEHDGGWAYRAGGTYSETFASHDEASAAARRAAGEQRVPVESEDIAYQDAKGEVHEEHISNEAVETKIVDGR